MIKICSMETSMSRLKLLFALVFSLILIPCGYSANVVLKDTKGHQIPFSSLKGKWVFINYWASWCQPCLDEISVLNRFYSSKKDNVVLFAVNYDMLPLSDQLALIKKYHIRYPSLLNDPASDLDLGDIRGVPATFVFNPEGELSDTLYGEQTLAKLNAALDS